MAILRLQFDPVRDRNNLNFIAYPGVEPRQRLFGQQDRCLMVYFDNLDSPEHALLMAGCRQ